MREDSFGSSSVSSFESEFSEGRGMATQPARAIVAAMLSGDPDSPVRVPQQFKKPSGSKHFREEKGHLAIGREKD